MKHSLTILLLLLLASGAFASSPFGVDGGVGPGQLIYSLSVYPNPSTSGDFKVEFQTNHQERLSIKVYNLIGREVYRTQILPDFGRGEAVISLRQLPKGVYMLEISRNDQERVTRRLSYM